MVNRSRLNNSSLSCDLFCCTMKRWSDSFRWRSEAWLALNMFARLFQSCNHDLHPSPAWISALRDQPWQLRDSKHRPFLQAGCRYEQPAGPPLCAVPAEHQLPGGRSGGWLWCIFVPVHRSPCPRHSTVKPGDPVQARWPPGLWLLPWNIHLELPRWGDIPCWVRLFWQP